MTPAFSKINKLRCLVRRSVAVRLLAAGVMVLSLAGAVQKPATVRLVVDYGDGVQTHFTALPWTEAMTVLDALAAAQKHPRGISFSHRGSGRSAMVTAIGNQKNEGGGEKSRNWMFYVNDKPAEVSAGVFKLAPCDAVLWKFQTYDYNLQG